MHTDHDVVARSAAHKTTSQRAEAVLPASIASLVGLLSATVQVVADVDRPDRYPALEETIAAAALVLQGMSDTSLPVSALEESLQALTRLAADVTAGTT